MNKNIKIGLLLITFTFFVGILLAGSLSYFNSKEIQAATEQCFTHGGTPLVEIDTFVLGYSFSCEK
ncbi:hypothetical protein PQ478_04955 [Alkalihalophilus pseudofirmus]|uniref:hypothetical protein n=1 Tax=Alkalihalophilus pseudofirmus TaxID=79885 RepID=UPI00259B9242|nr:hypothetical protein [Alkalihalophilus pseudofirmus]WEG17845.1 hypothetical protein PQ478_04955 [Alkalihalophilus pseudofirmus]